MAESGVPGVVAVSWTGVSGPPGLSAEITARFNRAINAALAAQDMKLALSKLGSDPLGGSAQDFEGLLAEEGPRWLEVVRASGLKFD
jgi:tripartite-type tricarboxylate transporter receptor subunit TctC